MKETNYQVGTDVYTIKITDQLNQLRNEWKAVCRNSIYYDPDYLELLEKYGPIGYSYYYAMVFKEGKALGVYYFQKKTIQLAKDFRVHTHSKNPIKRFGVFLEKLLFKFVNYEILVFGNVLLTGEYAYCFKEQNPGKEEFNSLTNAVIKR